LGLSSRLKRLGTDFFVIDDGERGRNCTRIHA